MRTPTLTMLITATLAAALAAGQPASAQSQTQSSVPLTADEKRENSRLSKAWNVSHTRKSVEVRFTYSEKCEAALAAGEPMPEPDLRITEEVEIDNDLINMTIEELSEQFGIASDSFYVADRAVKDCIRKFRKKNGGS